MSHQSIKNQVLSLGAARLIDYAMQFVLPMVLARVFAPAEYGQYMLLWLVVNTTLIVTTLNMPQSLFYVLPHSRSEAEKTRNSLNTLTFLAATGFLAAVAVNPWFPLLPERFVSLKQHAWVMPVFVFLWTVSQLLDSLPTVEERIRWQCWAIIGLSGLRAVLLAGVAWFFRDMDLVFLGLVLFACIKLLMLITYFFAYHPVRNWGLDRTLLWAQLSYSVPFGIGAALFLLRNQGDQWVAAYLFPAAEYSLFVIGMYLGPFLTLIRESINSAVMPKLNRSHAEGNLGALLELSRNTNTHTALILFPLLIWFFIFSADIIEVIFSATYRDAAAVMRIFILSYLTQTFEANNLFRIVDGGRYSIYLSLILLVPAVAVSYWGGITLGLWGVALGALVVTYSGETLKLRYVAQQLALPVTDIVDWSTWLILLAASLIAGFCAFQIMEIFDHGIQWPLLRCALGAVVIAISYFLIIRIVRGSLLSTYINMFRFRPVL
jgi:O-antigen/teichoic acid export membrane protein